MKFRWPWQKKAQAQPKECAHKYKDFPWYKDATYFSNWGRVELVITEPFVCVLCGHRIDKVLLHESTDASSIKKAGEWVESRCTEFEDNIRSRAVVEDMIADMQLVDRRFLEIAGMLEEFNPPPKLKVDEQ